MSPRTSAIEIDGIRRDQTEAATITPAAKPIKTFSILGLILFFRKKTIAEPRVVPASGIISVMNSDIMSP